jgi:hypothetical protein
MLWQLPWMPPSVPQTWAGLLMAGMMNPQAWLDALWYPFWAVNELGWMILFVTYDLEKLLYDALFPDVTWNCPWEYGTSDHAFSIMLDSGLTVVVDWCTIEVVTPDDPNEKAGPPGLGARRLMGADEELQYVVYFENQPSASAPAQEVFVTDDLDPDLDWSTFRPLEIAWGDQVIAASGEGGALATRQMAADHRPEVTKTWWVDVCAEIDYGSGRTLWTLRTLDPETGGLPEDALAGFLPPNDATHRGEGHIVFAVRPKAELADGALLSNQARIKFDTNEIIVTNVVTNTIGTLEPRLRLPVLMRNAARAAALAGAP